MTEVEIVEALEGHLATMADLPAVAWLNSDEAGVPPPSGAPYFSLSLARLRNNRVDISGNYHIKRGIFQVSVCTEEGIGDRTADALADAVVAHFPDDLRLDSIRIVELPSVGGPIPEGGEWRVPVSIYYEVL